MIRSLRRSLVVLFTVSLLAAACSDDTADDATDDTTTTTAPDATPAGDPVTESEQITATIEVVPSDASPLAATITIESDIEVTAQITATSDDHTVTTPTTAASDTAHTLPLVGFRQDRTYALAVNLTSTSGTTVSVDGEFASGSLPDVVPVLEIESDPERSSPGITILELNPVSSIFDGLGAPIVGIDEAGEPVWYYNSGTFSGAAQRTADGGVAFQHDPFAYSVNDITSRRIAEYYPDATGADEATVDTAGTQVIPYHADWVDLGPVHHDLVPMPDGSILGLSTTEHPVPAERRAELCPGDELEWDIFSDVIMHVAPDGTVMRTWDLYDVVSFDDHPGEFLCNTRGLGVTETRRDWTHANALWFDEARDAILVSSRHTDQIVALAMTDETGPQTGVRWILGNDATMPYDGESFHHTHGVKTVGSGDILLYDNGNFRPGSLSAGGDGPDYSRAVRIAVDDSSNDPADWTATQVWDHRMIDPITDAPLYAPFISDADELANGNILVTHGGATIDPANFLDSHVVVVEVVPDPDGGDVGGDIVWQLDLGDADNAVSMYRADRWETLYFGPLWATD